MRRRTRGVGLVGVLLVLVGVVAVLALSGGSATVRAQVARVPVGSEPDGTPVTLDTTLYHPAGRGPFPAVLLAHGFGGSKADEAGDARDLARHGYVALTWSARGQGASGGRVHLDAPAYEVRDASVLIDRLAARADVRDDGPGDPRVGVVGGSYGGALALLLAGTDPRVDAIVPAITWNDLGGALFPQSAVEGGQPTPAGVVPVAVPGVFARSWAGVFFGSAPGGDPSCGRFDPAVCAAYQASAAQGAPTPELTALMAASSPAGVLSRVRAPTLLLQGEDDSLFPLREADANGAGIAATGTPVRVVWFGGGHDGGSQETGRLRELTRGWLDGWLEDRRAPAGPAFTASVVTPSSDGGPDLVAHRSAGQLPGVTGGGPPAVQDVPLTGPQQPVAAPPAGSPAAVSTLPGLGNLAALAGAAAAGPPGQAAVFPSAPLARSTWLTGSATVDLRVTSSAGDAVLFAALYDDPGDGAPPVLPERLVAPVRVTVPAGGTTVRVVLPGVVRQVAAGHRLRLVVRSTDAAYALPADARTYGIALASGLRLPVVPTVPLGGGTGLLPLVAGLVVAAGVGLALAAVLRRRRGALTGPDPQLVGVPLVVEGLEKTYGNGYRAVAGLSFRVEHGQVLGLLGPNGAGKTTALRVVLGLLRPTAGSVRLYGFPVRPGAPVLSRVGAFVEGPGVLPHLTGRQNLALHWQTTGRPQEQAHLDAAVEVTGLGADLDRRAGSYSQGMRQRLAIAQAMLGLPELLVLDEPTNGLDPPQIREMREVLQRYAATGRTVLVSSHLLAEVEQTCTHVVVMARGRAVAAGPVAELVGAATALVVDVDDPQRAAQVAAALPGALDVATTATGLTLRLVGTPRAALTRALVDAGIGVDRLAPQRGLEEAFLALVGEA